MHKGQTHYQNPGNPQMLYPQQLQPNQQIIQGSVPVYLNNGQAQMRPAHVPRMGPVPIVSAATNYGQRNEVMPGFSQAYQVHPHYASMQNGAQSFQYQIPAGYHASRGPYHHPVYVMPNQYNMMQQQHAIPPTASAHIPTQRNVMYNHQVQQSQAAQMPPTMIQHQPQEPVQKKRTIITLKDPNTGKDLTNEILKKKTAPTSGYSHSSSGSPSQAQDENKAKIQATFAAQVYAVALSPSPSPQTESKTTDKNNTENIATNPVKPEALPADTTEKHEEIVSEVVDSAVSQDAKDEEPVVDESADTTIVESEKTEEVTPVETKTADAEPKNDENNEILESEPQIEESSKSEVMEEVVTASSEEVVESTPEEDTTVEEPTIESASASQEESENTGSAFTVTKKKKKNRFKEFDDNKEDDLLSAFTDKPVEEPVVKEEPEPVKTEKSSEDETWEEKEESIEKEVITNADVEEPEVIPKTAETKIIMSEDKPIPNDEEKLQYDRDFLLQFQFAPICTSKPANLPDIDIVLSKAHEPTRALVPGQRVSASNDFMPNFMRQASGGRSSGGGKSRKPGSARPTKVLHAPMFEKIELRKSENAWVRPSEKAKELTEDQRQMNELERNVRSILNKLTPQKFKTLVDQMLDLKIDSVIKLETAIDLIFEKAVGEPGFSVAYANMCRVLTDQFKIPLKVDKPAQPTVTFRKILLNKCQKEFEKESSDEKLLEEDRQKSFETEEEKKAWMEELNYRERMNRRRMLGNIRFIGELFKLKMISENIMHDCIFKLLRTEKQDSLEDQLECLCKLLSTIGKDLDHAKAKPRMEQYFVQINKIIEKRKISSRIKFALRDVIDLRGSGWVPRRDDGNPKTIDQIHREAHQKEKQEEMARQHDKVQRNVRGRGGGGGRDSPVVRSNGPPTGGDGWTNVSSKGNRQSQTPVDASKFKLQKKTDSSEISLGPGGRPGAWSRGASGGGSRSGSGSNTPTSEMDRPNNRFDILAESNVTPGSLDNKRGRGTPFRKGTPTGGRGRDERNSALRAVKDMMGRSSRNQSPARSSPSEDVSSVPSSGTQTPVEKSLSPNPISEEKMRKTTVSTLEEFFSTKDIKEADECIKELKAPHLYPIFVEEATNMVLEKKPDQRRLVGELFNDMIKKQTLNIDHICQGFNVVVQFAQELACDVPLIYTYLGEIIGPVVYDGTLPLNRLKDSLEPLVQLNKAGIVMAQALSVAVQIAGEEESISTLWSKSNLKWEMLLNNTEDVPKFLKDKKMEFTLVQSPGRSHASKVQDEMLRLLKENKDVNNQIMSLINSDVPPEVQNTTAFIKSLTRTICNSTVIDSCTCNKESLQSRSKLLLRYIDGKKDFELYALYGMQELVTELSHPRDLLRVFFEELYELNVISEETFYVWENSKEFPEGKGSAVSCARGFLQWLQKAEEESNEEEIAQTISNVA